MKNILTEALVNSVTNASFICSYTNSAKLREKYSERIIEYLYTLEYTTRKYTNIKDVI